MNLDHCESENSESWSRELFLVLQVVKEMVEVDQIIHLSVPSKNRIVDVSVAIQRQNPENSGEIRQ